MDIGQHPSETKIYLEDIIAFLYRWGQGSRIENYLFEFFNGIRIA
jgi:hypothetical protein